MKNKQFMLWSGVLLVLIILISGCAPGFRSETIVIPSKEDNYSDDQGSQQFKVKTIYRLPQSDQLLGWSAPETVIGLFRKMNKTERESLNLQRFTKPYEKPEMLQRIEDNMAFLELSPDGENIFGMTTSAQGASLKLISLPDGKETEVASFSANQQLFLQDGSWSNNSRYVCYLVIDAAKRGKASVGVYDIESGTLKTYWLKNFNTENTLTGVNISDDGSSVLFTMFLFGQSGRNNSIVMGTINESEINVQYEHKTGSQQNAWLNNDQFVFLGTEGTLYVYDSRNGELAVLLEKVGSFEFSRDRKNIAYSLYDDDTIYAGKLRGKNVLSEESIYHGSVPSQIYWSPDNNSLLIYGRKSAPMGISSPYEQPFIITFQ